MLLQSLNSYSEERFKVFSSSDALVLYIFNEHCSAAALKNDKEREFIPERVSYTKLSTN